MDINDIKLDEVFPWEYKGGGYFRKRGVKKGEKAEMLHGKEVAEYMFKRMKMAFRGEELNPKEDGQDNQTVVLKGREQK
jgi:hypothetical protein